MAIKAKSIFNMQAYDMAEILANCKAFQDWVSESDATGAKEHIFINNIKSDDIESRPFALIIPPSVVIEHGKVCNVPDGEIVVLFEAEAPSGEDIKTENDIYFSFTNDIGGIIEEIIGLNIFSRIGVEGEVGRTPENLIKAREKDICQIIIKFSWN